MATAAHNHPLNKVPVWIIFITLLHIAQPFTAEGQHKPAGFKTTADSMVLVNNRLRHWHPYAGLHLASDAELYYAGPSLQAGADLRVTHHLAFSSYIQYYGAGANHASLNQEGHFKTFTAALLVQANAGAGWNKGFFIAGGTALQRYHDRFTGLLSTFDEIRTTLTAAIRLGYTFPAGIKAIAVEFNGIGPYIQHYSPDETYMEIFTQVSLGVRLIF